MRAAAILGLGCSPKNLKPFQTEKNVDWSIGLPGERDQADVVLLFGGDGTVHRHLGQLVRLGLPVLIVPAGSGNDFAHALGFRTARDSLPAWQKFCRGAENIRKIDLGVVTPLEGDEAGFARDSVAGTRYFACVAGVGLDAEVARRANKIPRWLRSNGGYALTLIPTIFQFAPFRMKILTSLETGVASPSRTKTDSIANTMGERSDSGWTIRSNQPTVLAAFANTPLYGGGMNIAPHAKMDDGLLDICSVGAVDPFKLFCLFPTVYLGRHLKIRQVEYSQAMRVRIETDHPLDMYADGEFVCQTPAEIGVQRQALNAVTP
jgi:diacylglycerol kinase (ATP)